MSGKIKTVEFTSINTNKQTDYVIFYYEAELDGQTRRISRERKMSYKEENT